MQREKTKGRPRQKLLDNLLDNKIYEKKREAQDQAKWREEREQRTKL